MVYLPGGKSTRVYPPHGVGGGLAAEIGVGIRGNDSGPDDRRLCRINDVAVDLAQQRLRLGSGRRQQSN